MQTGTIVQFFIPFIQQEIARISDTLSKTWDFRQFEDDLTKLMNQLEACLIRCILEDRLTDPAFLTQSTTTQRFGQGQIGFCTAADTTGR